jgi:hypothetical protein
MCAEETADRERLGRRARLWSAGLGRWIAGLLLLVASSLPCGAASMLQFDAFLGFGLEQLVPEASWTPIVCEVKNDGLGFVATVDVKPSGMNQGAAASRMTVELPTGTLKRFVVPVYSGSRNSMWDVRLLDERGRVRAERLQLAPMPGKVLSRSAMLVGSIPRTAGGSPVIRKTSAPEFEPAVARIQPAIFPDNPLVLEGMDCLYINSERGSATDLTVSQVQAILAWIETGGHLIVAVEQPSDISSSPWLKSLFPCDVTDLREVEHHPELQDWLRSPTWSGSSTRGLVYSTSINPGYPATTGSGDGRNPFPDLPNDFDFEGKVMQVAVGQLHQGAVVTLKTGDLPLMITARHGRGRVTGLMFSPEREPMRSWKNLSVFWAKLAEVPAVAYLTRNTSNPSAGYSTIGSDGIFGAMIDSRQIHKLPIEWLLLLLLVYLVVIGPLDQFWLKRIGKPMLTWITFPCYVVLFSLVIYLIGYKLRAGESEWNELHLVDVFTRGNGAELRGRTYCSVYSPANQRYALESQQKYATFRGEFRGGWNADSSGERASIQLTGDSFRADVFVRVWTSELYVDDWWQPSPEPVSVSVQPQGSGWQVTIANHTDHKLSNLQLAIEESIYSLGELRDNQTETFTVQRGRGKALRQFVTDVGHGFQAAVNSRQNALGNTQRGFIDDKPNASIAASFLSLLGRSSQNVSQPQVYQGYPSTFVSPPGLDLSPVVEAGTAVLFAWAADYSPVKPINQFAPRRTHKNTLWRVSAPVR